MVKDMEEEKKNKKFRLKDIIIAVIPVLSFISVTVGATYAAYMASVVGNEESEETVLKSARVYAMFNANESISGDNILPGWSSTMNFSIVNTSPEDNLYANYTLAWEIEENAINDDNFVYTLECSSTKNGEEVKESEKNILVKASSPRKVPTVSTNIGVGMINTGVTHNCQLKIMLRESGNSQDNLQGKTFKGKIVAKGDPNV